MISLTPIQPVPIIFYLHSNRRNMYFVSYGINIRIIDECTGISMYLNNIGAHCTPHSFAFWLLVSIFPNLVCFDKVETFFFRKTLLSLILTAIIGYFFELQFIILFSFDSNLFISTVLVCWVQWLQFSLSRAIASILHQLLLMVNEIIFYCRVDETVNSWTSWLSCAISISF
jgi:hypothetical protein